MMKKHNRKGGFSIAEVVIALAVIVLVSMIALTIVTSSFAAKTTLITRSQGISFADNVWECFKAAKTPEEFNYFVKATTEDYSFDIQNKTPYSYSGDNFKATITVKYEAGNRPTLDIVVTENKVDGDEIISFSYVKGAKYYED